MTDEWKPLDPGIWRELRDESYFHYPVMEYELASHPTPVGAILTLLVRVARPDDEDRESSSVGLALLPTQARELGAQLLEASSQP